MGQLALLTTARDSLAFATITTSSLDAPFLLARESHADLDIAR